MLELPIKDVINAVYYVRETERARHRFFISSRYIS